jgi:transposase
MKKNTSKKQMAGKGKKETQGDFAFYIGIDLGDKNSDVCVLSPGGEVGKQFRLRMKEEAFQEYFSSIPRSRAAVEAGGQSRWVAEVIEKCGHEVYVSNTRKVPYIHQSDAKDDPGDAYKLAELVHFKPRLLHPIQHRSREAQVDLSWIRAREVLVESRTQLINAVRGLSQASPRRKGKPPSRTDKVCLQ